MMISRSLFWAAASLSYVQAAVHMLSALAGPSSLLLTNTQKSSVQTAPELLQLAAWKWAYRPICGCRTRVWMLGTTGAGCSSWMPGHLIAISPCDLNLGKCSSITVLRSAVIIRWHSFDISSPNIRCHSCIQCQNYLTLCLQPQVSHVQHSVWLHWESWQNHLWWNGHLSLWSVWSHGDLLTQIYLLPCNVSTPGFFLKLFRFRLAKCAIQIHIGAGNAAVFIRMDQALKPDALEL